MTTLVGTNWINDYGYEVKLLDFGQTDVWLYSYENKNKFPWNTEEFLTQYKLIKST